MKVYLIKIVKNKVETFHVFTNEKEIFTSFNYNTAYERYKQEIDTLDNITLSLWVNFKNPVANSLNEQNQLLKSIEDRYMALENAGKVIVSCLESTIIK